MNADLIFELYKDNRTVYTFQEIAMLLKESNSARLKQRIHYYVQIEKIKNLRRGIYAKENYSIEELACKIYLPSYISMEYVLQKAGIIFQYYKQITLISYLSRSVLVDENLLNFRKIKNNVLYNANGIIMNNTGINIASPERALLDILYLNKEFYVDSIKGLNKNIVINLLPMYQSNQLNKRLHNLLKDARYK